MKFLLQIPCALFYVLGIFYSTAMSFEPIDPRGEELVKSRLIPYPQKIELGNKDVVLDKNLRIEIRITNQTAALDVKNIVAKKFTAWFQSAPKIKITIDPKMKMDPEGYQIVASEGELILQANDLPGIRYAMSTIRQLAEVLPGTKTTQGWFIPEMKVDDYPALKFRGLHLCWFPETRLARIEQGIRMAAYYKFNYAVIELWGVYPYKALPEFAWTEHKISEDDIRALVRLSKELGIRLIPQFNLFGHATASRGSTGKHVLLDFHPEYAPLFEPDGWTWCLSNPETRKVLDGIVLELLDLYDYPEYFHLGCDEASSAGTCKVCRSSDYNEILYKHLLHFRDLLSQKKARPMIWHDMLINKSDPRWKGYTACGDKNTDQLTDRLPKDFIICDWQYSAPKAGKSWPTMDYFNEKGFDLIACPWINVSGIVSQAQKAAAKNYMGVLCTTWHHFYGRDMVQLLTNGSISLWGPARPFRLNVQDVFHQHLRQVGWEMKDRKYSELGSFDLQVPAETIGPIQ